MLRCCFALPCVRSRRRGEEDRQSPPGGRAGRAGNIHRVIHVIRLLCAAISKLAYKLIALTFYRVAARCLAKAPRDTCSAVPADGSDTLRFILSVNPASRSLIRYTHVFDSITRRIIELFRHFGDPLGTEWPAPKPIEASPGQREKDFYLVSTLFVQNNRLLRSRVDDQRSFERYCHPVNRLGVIFRLSSWVNHLVQAGKEKVRERREIDWPGKDERCLTAESERAREVKRPTERWKSE